MGRASGTIDVVVYPIHHNELWCYNIGRAERHLSGGSLFTILHDLLQYRSC
jgi:hypothetical protein